MSAELRLYPDRLGKVPRTGAPLVLPNAVIWIVHDCPAPLAPVPQRQEFMPSV